MHSQVIDGIHVQADMAIIELTRNIRFKETIQPIQLASKMMNPTNLPIDFTDEVFMSGWGTDHNEEEPEQLQYYSNIQILPKSTSPFWEEDENQYIFRLIEVNMASFINAIKYDHFLIFPQIDGKSGCYGDSGGPIVHRTDEKTELIAIVSNGLVKSCHDSFLSRHVDIFSLKSWIEETIKE